MSSINLDSYSSPSASGEQSQQAVSCGDPQSCPPSHEQIARGAYDLYRDSGWKQGQCKQNWLQAERSLRDPGYANRQSQQQNSPAVVPQVAKGR